MIPEAYSTGTVTGHWIYGTGANVRRGEAIFTPRAPALISLAEELIMLPTPRSAQVVDGILVHDGTPGIELPATDDPDISPVGWTWKVELRISGLDIAPFDIFVPAGTTLDLSSVVEVDAETGTTIIANPGPAGPIGPIGPIGPAGPAGPAGPGSAVDSVNGQTGVVVLDADDVGAVPLAYIGLLPGEANRGDWAVGESYEAGDVVHDHSVHAIFVAIAPSTGLQPSSHPAEWNQITDFTTRGVTFGMGATSGPAGVAIGVASESFATAATAVGTSASATGSSSTAVGFNSSASGGNSAAMGVNSLASGDYALAMGEQSDASGADSLAMGRLTSATGDRAIAIGQGITADEDYELVLGTGGPILSGKTDGFGTATGATNHAGLWDMVQTAVTTDPDPGTTRLIARAAYLAVRDSAGDEQPVVTGDVLAAELTEALSSTDRPYGISVRSGGLDSWHTKLATARTAPVDVVVLGDSYGTIQSYQSWPRALGYHLTRLGGTRPGGFRGVPPGNVAATPRWLTTGAGAVVNGTLNLTVTGQQGLDMSAGQKSTMVDTCDGVTIVYTASAGSLIVRDGVGGTVLGTIDGTAVSGSGNIWTSGALAYAARTIEVEASGGTFTVDYGYLHREDRTAGVRTWSLARIGAQTSDWDDSGKSLDFITKLEAAGTLGLVIIGTGTNDPGGVDGLPSLIANIRAVTSAPIVVTSPYVAGTFDRSEGDARIAAAVTAGADAIIDMATIAPDAWPGGRLISGDNVHPTLLGATVQADAFAAFLSGDPLGVLAYRATSSRPVATRWDAPLSTANPSGADYAEATPTGITATSGTSSMVASTAGFTATSATGSFAAGPAGITASVPGGKWSISSVFGSAVSQLFAGSDANSQVAMLPAAVATLLALPGASISLGPGGSTLWDTHLSRAGAGVLSANAGAGTVAARKFRLTDNASLPAGPNVVGEICSHSGVVKVCTVAGSPGTWAALGGGGAQTILTPTYTGSSAPMNVSGAGTGAGNGNLNVLYRSALVPIWLPAGTYTQAGVLSTVSGAGTTWELGVRSADPTTLLPGALISSLGTINMAAAPGLQLLTTSLAVATGWYYAELKVTAYGSPPSVNICAVNINVPAPMGWPSRGNNQSFAGLAVGVGVAGPISASAPVVGLGAGEAAFAPDLPRVYFGRN